MCGGGRPEAHLAPVGANEVLVLLVHHAFGVHHVAHRIRGSIHQLCRRAHTPLAAHARVQQQVSQHDTAHAALGGGLDVSMRLLPVPTAAPLYPPVRRMPEQAAQHSTDPDAQPQSELGWSPVVRAREALEGGGGEEGGGGGT